MNTQNQILSKSTTIDLQDGIYRYVYAEGLQLGSRINTVSIEAEWLFIRCLAMSDDFGIFPANPAKCLYKAAPRRSKDITEDQIKQWLDELERNNLIVCYTTLDGDTYAAFLDAPPNAKRPNGRRISRYPQPTNQPDLVMSPNEFGYFRVNPGVDGESGGSGGIRGIQENPGDPGDINSNSINNRKRNCSSSSNSLTCTEGVNKNNGKSARTVQTHAAAADNFDLSIKAKKAAIQTWGIDNPKAAILAGKYPGSVLEIHLLGIKAHSRKDIKNPQGMHAKLLADCEQPIHKSRTVPGPVVKKLIDNGFITHIGKYLVNQYNTKYWNGQLSASYKDLDEPVVFDKASLTHDIIVCRDLSQPVVEQGVDAS